MVAITITHNSTNYLVLGTVAYVVNHSGVAEPSSKAHNHANRPTEQTSLAPLPSF